MKRIAILFGIVALAGCRSGNSTPPEPEPEPVPPPVEWSADMQAVAEGNNRFATDIYGKLSESEKGKNLFFSPYSIHTALGMTATGAKGTTRDQMVKVLHLPEDEQRALASGDMGRYYAHPRKDYELSVANALWGQKDFPWRAEWLAVQNERFGAGFNEVDFFKDKLGSIARINGWVEEKTRGKIQGLLKPEDVPVSGGAITRLILTNAIYFKGKWADEFTKNATTDQPFHLAAGGSVPAPLMARTGTYGYADLGELQALELPYKGSELSMVVLLPRKADGLPAIEKQLAAVKLSAWMGKLESKRVSVHLPRFKQEQRFEPRKQLEALGMLAAFDPEVSDFSGMADLSKEAPLFIYKVIHQSFVDVNEEGTEAAAATAVVMATPASAESPPVEFRADRPFLFLIRDVKHGTILFMGRVMNPKG